MTTPNTPQMADPVGPERSAEQLDKLAAAAAFRYALDQYQIRDLVDLVIGQTPSLASGAYLALCIASRLDDSSELEFRQALAKRIES